MITYKTIIGPLKFFIEGSDLPFMSIEITTGPGFIPPPRNNPTLPVPVQVWIGTLGFPRPIQYIGGYMDLVNLILSDATTENERTRTTTYSGRFINQNQGNGTIVTHWTSNNPPPNKTEYWAASPVSNPGITIINATYAGVNNGIDVTAICQLLVDTGFDEIAVNNKTFQGDPNPNTTKYFTIIYGLDNENKNRIKGCIEGTLLSLVNL